MQRFPIRRQVVAGRLGLGRRDSATVGWKGRRDFNLDSATRAPQSSLHLGPSWRASAGVLRVGRELLS